MRKYLFFLFGLLVMFTPLESHAQSYELGFACFYDGYWGSWYNTSNYNIWGNYGVTMAVLSCMIIMNILQITDLSFK